MDIFIVVVGGGGVVAGVEEGVGVGRCVGDEEEYKKVIFGFWCHAVKT